MKLFLFFFMKVILAESKLVFPPNSDVGYIIPDSKDVYEPENLETSQIDSIFKYFNAKNQPLEHKNEIPEEIYDPEHVIKMGVSNPHCDDGKRGLGMDWDGSSKNYTCPTHSSFPADSKLDPINVCTPIEPYTQYHFCMDKPIVYPTNIPTFGDHRPLWPRYGEYKFVPPQRWVHSIEHGALVMLYHPCAKPKLVNQLRSIVTGCLYRHIITPHNTLSLERPLALATWGCRLEMASVDENMVKTFIREKALHGPERDVFKDGQYDKELMTEASIVIGSDQEDSNLCPK